jgi:Spy/CpxP family protein refolding chaperone
MTTTFRLTAAAGLVALCAAGIAPFVQAQDAQPAPPMGRMRGPGPGSGFGPPPGGPMGLLGELGRGLRELGLSDAQREQIRGILQSRESEMREIGDRLRSAHEALNAVITADSIDEAAIRARSGEVGAIEADAAVLRAKVHQEVFGVLTAEQQAKARELRAQAAEQMKQRAGAMRERRRQR